MRGLPDFRAAPVEEQSIVIVGGTSGLGLASARLLVSEGARHVTLLGRDAARGERAAAELAAAGMGGHVHFVQGDVADPATADRLAAHVQSQCGGLDSIVTSAGGSFAPTLFHKTDRETVRGIVDQWLMGTIYIIMAALPLLRERNGGSIITVASDAGKIATPGEAVIGSAMAAIMMFSRTLALECARFGIRVNCLTPSLIEGTLTYEKVMSDPFSARLFEKAVQRAKLGLATPHDQAELVRYLISPAAKRLTGQAISINGGISAA